MRGLIRFVSKTVSCHFLACALALHTSIAFAGVPVEVIVDMDSATPGVQSILTVEACTTSVAGVAIYVRDPLARRSVWSIGFLGALDRGIAFGHAPSKKNRGSVTEMHGAAGTPVNPGNMAFVYPPFMPAFAGPEVQYSEWNAETPSLIPANPARPIFTVNLALSGAAAGDEFSFHLADLVTIWSGGDHGAFSTQMALNSLDSGGDVTPDGTVTLYGIDPDSAVAAPPAAFEVDYIDGPLTGGGALIQVVPKPGDANGDCVVNVNDLLLVVGAWGPCPPPPAPPAPPSCPADLNHDGTVDVNDLLEVVGHWS